MKTPLKYLLIILFSMTLFACGGGGGDDDDDSGGGSGAVSINSTNERDLGIAATEAVKQAFAGQSGPFRPADGPEAALASLSVSTNSSLAGKLLAAPVDISSSICTDGGSATSDSNSDGSMITISYMNCTLFGVIFDGVATVSTTESGSVITTSIEYEDFTVTIDGETTTLDLEVTCTLDSSDNSSSCTYDSDVTGPDGRTYSVSGSEISGDSSSGYTVSSSVTDPDWGTFSFTTTTPLKFDCTNGFPSEGAIQFTDSDGITATITYNDCNSFTIAYDGSSTVYNWSSI